MAEGDYRSSDSEQRHAEAQQRLAELLRKRDDARLAAIKFVTENPEEVVPWEDPAAFTLWIGTQEALIAQGVCSPEQFPAGRKRNLYDFETSKNDSDVSWRTKRIRGRICEHTVSYQGKTRDRILRERAPPPARGKEYDSPAAYAKYAELMCGCWLSVITERISGRSERETYGAATLMYDQDTVDRVIAACDAIEQYLQAGTVAWTKAAVAQRKAVEAQRGAVKTARTDQAFTAFLSRSLGREASGGAP